MYDWPPQLLWTTYNPPMKKEELFRQCVLCDNEMQEGSVIAEYYLMLTKAVIEKKGWHGDYVEWLYDQDCKRFERHKAFPKDDIVEMLD